MVFGTLISQNRCVDDHPNLSGNFPPGGGGSCEEQLPQNKQWKMGRNSRFFCRFFSWTKWIWMKLFFHFVEWQLNWDSETCRIFYQKVLKKDQSQSYANRFFKKLLPPKLVRTWARIPFLWTQAGEIQSFKKHREKKNHVSNFPQKEHPDFQGWKNIQKNMDSWILGGVERVEIYCIPTVTTVSC